MLIKSLLISVTTALLAASLSGCGGGADGSDIASELKTPNTSGAQENDGLISQKNFLIEFSEVAPAFLDLAANTTTSTTSDVTVSIADNNNHVITVPKTIFFETEWGSFDKSSCETDSTGSCTVTWRTGKINDTSLIGFRNTIVAYSSKSGETGQESFFDANGNGLFNDGETATDLDEPFIDRDDSFSFTTGIDKVIDTINGVDPTGADGKHNGGDGFYNGPNCSHSSLCSTTRGVSTVWASGSLQLTGTDTFTVGGTITGLVGTGTLLNNGGDAFAMVANGSFTFATPLKPGQTYNVTVSTQPATVTCLVTNGSGTLGSQLGGNTTTVVVTCN